MSAGTPTEPDRQAQLNAGVWARGEFLGEYVGGALKPVESLMLERHRGDLQGKKVLEFGCGAGRLTERLIELADHLHGLDIAPVMVEYCRRAHPLATFAVQDMGDLSGFADGSWDALVAAANVLDVFGDSQRRRVLGELGRITRPGGLLILSSHNLAYAPRIGRPLGIGLHRPIGRSLFARTLRELPRIPRRVRNRRQLARFEHRSVDHAVLVDEAHDFRLLHYYTTRDAQEVQLNAAGFELLECLDLDGRTVAAGASAECSSELHYVARRARASSSSSTRSTSS